MINMFDNILDSIEAMDIQEQQMIVDIIQNRIAEKRRDCIIKEVRQGRLNYKNGNVKRGSKEELLKEIYE
ncbi:MAG: hypothetical protein QG635_111 [Bacteroidota bacterium]|nr:hypothetical protein [Bacteroidota bacterium]